MTMIADDALKAKQDQVRACTIARESLLRQLFHSTVSFLKTNNVDIQEDRLSSFLDANDLSQDRYFHPSTLPALPSSSLPGSQAEETLKGQKQHERPQKNVQDGGQKPDELGQQENGTPVEGRAMLHYPPPKLLTLQDSVQEKIPSLSPLSSAANDSSVKDKERGERTGKAGDVPMNPSDAKETRSEDLGLTRVSVEKQGSAAELEYGEREDQTAQAANHLTPPDSGRNVYASSNRQNSESASTEPSDSASKPRETPSRNEDFAGTPCTPDEQLRLEEARSLHESNALGNTFVSQDASHQEQVMMQPQADLPSQFIRGNIDEDSEMMDVPDLTNDGFLKQNPFAQHRQSDVAAQINPPMRTPMFTGMNCEGKDLTFSRRPPMRIDTGVASVSDQAKPRSGSIATTTNQENAIPSKSTPLTSSAQPPTERMTTRVSSGVLRHKSVSEILGGTPKSAPTPVEKGFNDASKDGNSVYQTPKSASSFTSPDPAAFKRRLNELKEKEKNKVNVVFAKQQASGSSRISDISQVQREDNGEKPVEDRDYLLTLFTAQVSSPPRKAPLSLLLRTAHKTLMTSDHYVDIRERQDCRILNKVYEMQAGNKWSLRQLERSPEPPRPVVHWDVLLSHMRWMRTDFREERKWKYTHAKHLADACADWIASSPEARRLLQVKVQCAPARMDSDSLSATPDLVHTAEDEASEATDDDFPRVENMQASAPAAIFSLPPDMFIFGLNKSPVAEKLLLELPLYQPGADVQVAALGAIEMDPDAEWRTPIVPVSKHVQGKIICKEDGPPRKKGRLIYDDDEGTNPDLGDDQVESILEPEQDDVALFNPENKHIRDRIHAGHAFRPPSEHVMPSQRFFECRPPSQWTLAEDDELRKLVREYAYNWSLISSCLSSPSMFSSGAERRTPWECFERWIDLEGLPPEMSKVPYFRQYHERLQLAQRSFEARQQALLQHQGHNATQISLRRSKPFTVERRKDNRHIHLIDAMRKNAKRRESALHKQQHVAGLAAMRKAAEAPKARQQMHTPQEFSRIKHERHLKLIEQQRAFHMQLIQQKANHTQRNSQQTGQQSNGAPAPRNLGPGEPNNSSPNITSNVPLMRGSGADQVRSGPQMPRLINGQMNGVLPANSQSAPHAPMQTQLPTGGQRIPPQVGPDNMRVLQEAHRVQEHQAYIQQQRQQQQQRHASMSGQAGSPNMQNLSHLPQNNPSMLASMQDRSSPSINGVQPPPGTTASPHINQPQPQSLSSGMTPAVNQIQTQVKLRNPQASPEQVTRMTTEQLFRMSQQVQAMNAAGGNHNASVSLGLQAPSPLQQQQQQQNLMTNGASPMLNPQQYAQVMRMQQANQQRGATAANGVAAMNQSRSATPLIQRSGSAQGGRGPSQSPRAGQMAVARGQ